MGKAIKGGASAHEVFITFLNGSTMKRIVIGIIGDSKAWIVAMWAVVGVNILFIAELTGALVALGFTIILGIWSLRAKKKSMRCSELDIKIKEAELERILSNANENTDSSG